MLSGMLQYCVLLLRCLSKLRQRADCLGLMLHEAVHEAGKKETQLAWHWRQSLHDKDLNMRRDRVHAWSEGGNSCVRLSCRRPIFSWGLHNPILPNSSAAPPVPGSTPAACAQQFINFFQKAYTVALSAYILRQSQA